MKFDNNIIIFNGEIYNYIELKKKTPKKITLKQNRNSFALNVIQNMVTKMNSYLEGMWSYAIFDQNKTKLILSRDRFGEKPLFYSS